MFLNYEITKEHIIFDSITEQNSSKYKTNNSKQNLCTF